MILTRFRRWLRAGITRRSLLATTLLGLGAAPVLQAANTPTITLIIDDLGYNLRHGMRAVALPGEVNYAVLPHTPYSKRLAREAHQRGKTVMLHAPMTNLHHREPGPGTLSGQMDRSSFNSTLQKALADVPYVQGVNNHMGSQLTQDKTRMQWLMEEVGKRRLFFIDSRTTAQSVAAGTARANGIPSMSRDVFLDHIRTPEAVNEAFDNLIRQARRNGHAVGIGHPHAVTLAMLEQRLPQLRELGIRLISVNQQLLALGQVYPEQQTEAALAKASAGDSPVVVRRKDDSRAPRSPLFWQNPTLAQLESAGAPVTGSANPLGEPVRRDLQRRPLQLQRKDAIGERRPLPDTPAGTPMPHYRNGVRPGELSDIRNDLSQQDARVPDGLTPLPQQHWDDRHATPFSNSN